MTEPKHRPRGTPPASPARSQAETLVRDFNQSLVRMLQARLGSREDAHEVAQEAYARLLNLGDGNAIGFHSAYLFRIAQNLATDRLRRRAHMEQPAEADLALWPDPAVDPERSAGAAQIVERLPALLAELPPRCAEAFRLVRLQQLGYGEAAARLGLTERMVRIHVARALAHCQQRLDEGAGTPAQGREDA
ncbi:RNA polymerase sigma factor [Luteimonas wenzhouensis]|jgi:RNA polymerase sigma factor (sigma-70 family)|uniref:RNA polymerase sigma factor n=1 Tax=Luteimonas wenzhouensis TaxID=2599615 RepID=A0A5C5U5M1_9GAMM|nr:RNA polymerase sigma factor [Luteimonas wenzhouensis]TWT20590.1 RNA polymerase sigma factor [Luteimonas wenzhouensis]